MTETEKIPEKLQQNKKFQSKLSWKRIKALKLREEINSFINDNFGIDLPKSRAEYNKRIAHPEIRRIDETLILINENYSHLAKAFYSLGDMGLSVAAKYEQGGTVDTYTMGHLYTKHRICPVWNWRKSQLIRSLYRRYLLSNENLIYEFHPVHMVLTLPHPDGKYNGKTFYARELLDNFRELRRRVFWKKYVYAGEYGIETKINKNGFHIHLHSLVFLKNKSVENFRDKLRPAWEKMTGATQIWAETLYFYKRDESGNIIKQIKDSKEVAGYFDGDEYLGGFKKVAVPKKFYVDRERREIERNKELTENQKRENIINTYIRGILECIKYHFKGDDLFSDIDDLEKVLSNTQGKRLYSRFGKFYKEPQLNFNQIADDNDDDILSESTETAINPFTQEAQESTAAQLVTFYPESQRRQPATSPEAFELINKHDKKYFSEVPAGLTVSQVLKNIIQSKFNSNNLPNTDRKQVEKNFKKRLKQINEKTFFTS